ncbi:MAG: DUF2301 domain-containing membrane protein [Aphanocapsa lilacina HA4352-LM1]|jgi:uncharacterized integral membrane protein|nr:DUF2301 domain-containing membrane protein [Aphanocapsa lilacina HA4352-LM1]
MAPQTASNIYSGRFGTYEITEADRRGVLIYRLALLAVAVSFAAGGAVVLAGGSPWVVTALFALLAAALGVALATVHIYLLALHRALWLLWAVGVTASAVLTLNTGTPLALIAYSEPVGLIATGFVFAALTGICIKESFCFGWWETVLVVPALPLLLLGHLGGILSPAVETGLFVVCAVSLLIFAIRKFSVPAPDDIGDKSVHAYVRGEIHG